MRIIIRTGYLPISTSTLLKMFKIHRKYVIRHAILKQLKSKIDKRLGDERALNLSHTSMAELAKTLKLSFSEVYEYHHAMMQLNQVKCTPLGGKYYLELEENGYAALVDEYWIRQGERELNEKIYDKVKWLVPVIALVVTAGSLIFSTLTIQKMTHKIDGIKIELEKLKTERNPVMRNPPGNQN